jgi:hypothetical protein
MARKRLCEELEPLLCKILTNPASQGQIRGYGKKGLLGNFSSLQHFQHSNMVKKPPATLEEPLATHIWEILF